MPSTRHTDSKNDLQIEIVGLPKFHALHWESLKDPKLAQPLALQATMVRKNLKPSSIASFVRSFPIINLLIVTARPSGIRDVGYRTISRPLVDALRNANLRVQVEILRPGTYKSLENHLRDVTAKHGEGYYHVIHFDVHGAVLTYQQFQQEQTASRYPIISVMLATKFSRMKVSKPFCPWRANKRKNQTLSRLQNWPACWLSITSQ